MPEDIKADAPEKKVVLDGKEILLSEFKEKQAALGKRIVENADAPGTYRTLQHLVG